MGLVRKVCAPSCRPATYRLFRERRSQALCGCIGDLGRLVTRISAAVAPNTPGFDAHPCYLSIVTQEVAWRTNSSRNT